MKRSRWSASGWGVIFGLLGFWGSGWSEPIDPFAPGAKVEEGPREWIWYTGLTVQLEYIEVSAEEYFRLSDAHWKDRGMAMRKEVEKMIGEGKAEVLETVAVKTRDGERARVESVLEFCYPTEFDVPEGLQEPVTESARKKLSEIEDADWEALLPHVARGAMTGFDVRNVGITCEVDPVMGADGVTVDLNFAPEITDMVGQVPQTVIAGRETGVNQPNLFTRRLSTSDSHRSGEHVFQTAFSPPGADGAPDRMKKVMLFTRVLVHRVAESEEELKAREEEMRRWEERHGVESAEGKVDPFAPVVPKEKSQTEGDVDGVVFADPEVDVFDAPKKVRPASKKVEKFERPEEPRGVSLQFEFFKVDHGEVTRLLNGYDPAKDEDGKGLRGAVKKMEAEGKAELQELLVTRTKGGTRSKVEAIHEVIFTNDFDPPTHPDEKALNQRLRDKRQRETDGADEEGDKGALPEKSEAVAVEDGETKEKQHVFRSVPNSFDRRNTGRWVEVDPVVTRNGRVQLALAPESVRLIRWEDYGPGVKEPFFFREVVSTSIVIQSDGYALISVGAPPGEDGKTDRDHRTLVFVHAVVHGK